MSWIASPHFCNCVPRDEYQSAFGSGVSPTLKLFVGRDWHQKQAVIIIFEKGEVAAHPPLMQVHGAKAVLNFPYSNGFAPSAQGESTPEDANCWSFWC